MKKNAANLDLSTLLESCTVKLHLKVQLSRAIAADREEQDTGAEGMKDSRLSQGRPGSLWRSKA